MPFWIYILRCSDGSYYTGHTDNLEKRMAEHQTGEILCYASKRLPVELVFSQEFQSRAEALERERQVKGWNRAKKEALIRGDWVEISRLARSGHPSTGSG
jgi:predicted GIY-YIG superfamily endonuclease